MYGMSCESTPRPPPKMKSAQVFIKVTDDEKMSKPNAVDSVELAFVMSVSKCL